MMEEKKIKILGVKNYGSTPHLRHSKLGQHDKFITQGQHDIIFKKPRKGDLIIVTEKYDGTNAGISRVNGKIVALTRSGHLAKESEYWHYRDFAEWVAFNNHHFYWLKEGHRIVGEWMLKRISIEYVIKDPICLFMPFDIFDENNKRIFDQRAYITGYTKKIDGARLLAHQKTAINHDDIIKSLFDTSNKYYSPVYSIGKPEGYVVQVWRLDKKGNMVFDFQAKWVRHDFAPGLYLEVDERNVVG